ncbi:MAG: type II secretion system F family protein [Candidatus Omnitrophica bacterium]|nr:type II secretion system F family protein [Candidatus Omnitrophota bacterium]
MGTFAYNAKFADGRAVSGTLEAPTQEAVLQGLHQKGLIVVSIQQTKARFTGGRASVKLDDLAIFCRQMATLVDAGIPIVGGLEAVGEQVENKTLREAIHKVRESVEGGMNLTAAVAKQNKVFSPLFVNMMRAGEASGHLAEVLDRLATYLEKSAYIQRKVRTALVYPSVVVSMAGIITVLLLVTVVPSFKEIFTTLGSKLPLPTQILLAVSDFMRQSFILLIAASIGAVYGFKRGVLGTARGRLFFDRMMLRVPMASPIVRKVAIAKFSRTLSTLVRSGVQILQALEIVSETAGNRVVADAILKVKASIKEGENIATPLAASGVFPPMVVRMIAVGEQTGRLDEMLSKIAEFYEDQVDAAVSGLTSAIEPLIIAVLGVVIGSIVAAIFLPIFQMSSLVH